MLADSHVKTLGFRLRRCYDPGARYRRAMRAYVGLGSNLGDREQTIRSAVASLDRTDGIAVVRVSTLRETEPWGPVPQPPFVNAVVAVETDLAPRALLGVLLDVERRLGRVRAAAGRWGPRAIDLDLLLYGEEVVDEPGLAVPHPHLHERRFALEPLAELDPEALVPGHGPAAALLSRLGPAGETGPRGE
jgi:2-amino-4-hydroxy-6-hydroxymethyldihydropteridine diphosphokinase